MTDVYIIESMAWHGMDAIDVMDVMERVCKASFFFLGAPGPAGLGRYWRTCSIVYCRTPHIARFTTRALAVTDKIPCQGTSTPPASGSGGHHLVRSPRLSPIS